MRTLPTPRPLVWSLSAVALITLAVPATTRAQAEDDRLRLGAHLALGLAGDATLRRGGFAGDASLDATVGGAVRVEAPLHDFFVLGGWFEVLAFEWDGLGAEREPVLNFDVLAKGRYPIELDRDLILEPYLAVPLGLSIAILDNGGDEAWPGWNLGVLAGAALLIEPAGFFFELGWRFHQVFNEASSPLGDVDLEVNTNQLAIQLGGFVRL